MPLARKELHALLEDPELQKMPLLVLGNKIDLEPHMSKEEIIKGAFSVAALAAIRMF